MASKSIYRKTSECIITAIIPVVIVLLTPFDMTFKQSIIFAATILAVIWWSTGYVDKTFASIFLLGFFLLYTDVEAKVIFRFPLSTSFIMVASSFLLAEGIMKSKMVNQHINFLVSKYCMRSSQLVTMTFVLAYIMTIFVPHPFPRVIILSSVYHKLLERYPVIRKEYMIIMFAASVSGIATSMILKSGDVILNYTALDLVGITLTTTEWIKVMFLPASLMYIGMWGVFMFLFRKELVSELVHVPEKWVKQSRQGRQALIIMSIVVLLWLTEGWHHLDTGYAALLGVVGMLGTGILKVKDHYAMNYKLLIMITSIISIGKVFVEEGVASKLSNQLIAFFPPLGSPFFIMATILTVMIVHLLIGSAIATLSVILVALVTMANGSVNPLIIAMIAFIIVNNHYILPVHQTVLFVGFGKGDFDTKIIARFGGVMTVFVLISLYGLFFPWWNIIGIM